MHRSDIGRSNLNPTRVNETTAQRRRRESQERYQRLIQSRRDDQRLTAMHQEFERVQDPQRYQHIPFILDINDPLAIETLHEMEGRLDARVDNINTTKLFNILHIHDANFNIMLDNARITASASTADSNNSTLIQHACDCILVYRNAHMSSQRRMRIMRSFNYNPDGQVPPLDAFASIVTLDQALNTRDMTGTRPNNSLLMLKDYINRNMQ